MKRFSAAVLAFALTGCAVAPAEVGPIRVAACQIEVDGDREAAFARIDLALADAAAQGAQIACFPETALLGWVNPLAHEEADPIPGPTTERLSELARRHGVMIAIGLAERDGKALHDSAVLIDLDGTLLMRHRKVNILTELMTPPYTAGLGAANSVVDTRFGRIGLLICADTFDDELVDELAAQEPRLVLVPFGWAAAAERWPGHGRSLHAWISHTATRTGAPVVGVDAIGTLAHGPWKGFLFGGQSTTATAEGQLSHAMSSTEAEVRVYEIATR